MPDERYLSLCFKAKMGYEMDWQNPVTYSEKLQWLKVHDRDPFYTTLVDKYAVKSWVAERIGKEFVTPTYGKWDSADAVDFDSLPDSFVLKTNHDSGGVAICRSKGEFDREVACRKLDVHLKRNYFWSYREWPYKDVEPCIFAEEYLEDVASGELPDYKFFCFDGEPRVMFIATERMSQTSDTKFDFYDMDFNHLPFTNGHPNSERDILRPEHFDEMRNMAAALSRGIPHVRVDFYEAGGRVYFGEMTFYHWSGLMPFDPPEWDRWMGDMIKLPDRSAA